MIELNENTAKITLASELVKMIIVFKDKKLFQELPIPQNQNYAELSNLGVGEYIVVQLDENLDRVAKRSS